MTVHTPTHVQARKLINLLHGLDGTMASLTVHTTSNVRGVIELHVIRKHVNLGPLDGLTFVICFTQFLDIGAVGFHREVTVHTGAQCRNVGMP